MWIPIEVRAKRLHLETNESICTFAQIYTQPCLNPLDFKPLFEQFTNQKILIIGDVMIDTYLWGSVARVSPEAPVPIVSGVIEENRLGGAANVALNIKAMGAVPILCSVIGDDDRGKLILELMEEQLLSDIGLVVDNHRVTTQKTRIISWNQHLLRVDEEMDIFLNKRVQEEFLELISSLLESGGIDAIIMQDYDKGVLDSQGDLGSDQCLRKSCCSGPGRPQIQEF